LIRNDLDINEQGSSKNEKARLRWQPGLCSFS
jgi:hypothetical protein